MNTQQHQAIIALAKLIKDQQVELIKLRRAVNDIQQMIAQGASEPSRLLRELEFSEDKAVIEPGAEEVLDQVDSIVAMLETKA